VDEFSTIHRLLTSYLSDLKEEEEDNEKNATNNTRVENGATRVDLDPTSGISTGSENEIASAIKHLAKS
jgi:hypothetical protein